MKLKIRTKLIGTFIVVFTIPIILASLIFYVYAHNFAMKSSLNLNMRNMNYVSSSIDLVFEYAYNYSLYPPFDSSITTYLTADSRTEQFHDVRQYATDSIILLPYTNATIQGISIWRNDGNYIKSGRSIHMTEEEKQQLLELKGAALWKYESEGTQKGFYLSRLLKNPTDLQKNLGYIKIKMDDSSLYNAVSNEDAGEALFFIRDGVGNIYSITDNLEALQTECPQITEEYIRGLEKEFLKSIEGKSYYDESLQCYITTRSIAHTDWMICSVAVNSFTMSLLGSLWQVFVLFVLICIPACIILAMVFSTSILSPLKKMGELMHQIEKENFAVHLEVNGNDELAVLATQFNHMSDELSELYNHVYLSNIRVKEAQLAALQAQINPHFLYNTLDTIYWMSEYNHTPDVSQMISSLSSLFRLSLSGDQNDRISLKSELEHVECFLYIEKIRYDEQLQYTLEIPDEELRRHADEYMVLKLILQPIAENAILHGIEECETGHVRIRILLEEDHILYEISNTGTADIEHIQHILEDPTYQASSIGLCNIQQRIQLKYGEEYGIICFNLEDETVFQVRLPIQKF